MTPAPPTAHTALADYWSTDMTDDTTPTCPGCTDLDCLACEQSEVDAALEAGYQVGDRVILCGYADGENGPHPSDLDQPTRYAEVRAVVTHPANPAWITDYLVAESEEVAPGVTHVQIVRVTPGAIARRV
jgi:hypothetical protein